jgi:hypothetical protein
MNINELKLVLEMVGTVSGDAKTVAIVWLATGVLELLIVMGGFAAVVVFLARTLVSLSEASKTVSSINRLLGYPGSSNPFYPREFDAIVSAVQDLKQRSEEK